MEVMVLFSWCFWDAEPFCFGWFAEKLLLPLTVAAVVTMFAIWQLGKKREIDFADKQLSEFYGPMVAAREEVREHTQFDRLTRAAAQRVDSNNLRRERRVPLTPERISALDEQSKKLEVFFVALNERLLGETIDGYVTMRKLFAAKMAFADADTRAWFPYFYAFVEMWEILRKDEKKPFLPDGVMGTIGQMFDEELLQPFYAHLTERLTYLQDQIAGKRVVKNPAPTPPSTTVVDLMKAVRKKYDDAEEE